MIAFDVFCNEKFLCRMGIPEKQQVLSLSLTNPPQQDQVSLIAIGNTQSGKEFSVSQSEAEKIERFKALIQKPALKWATESLTPPFTLEIRVVETDDLESISPPEELIADLTAIDPRILNQFAHDPNSSSS